MLKIIDSHLHYCQDREYFFEIAKAAGHENSESHLRKVFRELGVVHAVVMGNRDLDFELHQYPDFLSYCIGLDRTYLSGHELSDAVEMVEAHFKRKNCVGLKLYPGYNDLYVYDSAYFPFYELAEKYHKPVAIHTGTTAGPNARLRYSHPLTVDEVAVRFPYVQFILCHFGNPWLVDAAAVLEKNGNVAADPSGLLCGRVDIDRLFQENAGYIEALRTWIAFTGAYDRFLYGTDWPLVNLNDYLAFARRLIPERHQQAFFFDNANRIYRLVL